jgi:PEP-CTERM motif
MGRNLLLSAICAVSFSLGLFGALSEAAATPFTYEFKLPSWTFNSAPTVFGASAVFDVTVNNGGSSGTSQSFAFSDIQSVSVTAVGGSCSPCFNDTWPGTALSGVSVPNTVFLLTDPSGVPTLDLSLQSGDTNFVSYTNANQDYFSISQPGIFGYVPSEIDLSNGVGSAGIYDSPFSVLGSTESSVASSLPEPSTLALFGGALVALGWSLRRRKLKLPCAQ